MRQHQDCGVSARESLEVWGFRLGLLSFVFLPTWPAVTAGVWAFLGICLGVSQWVQWSQYYWTEVALGRR